jgi:hypothetical protein
MAPGDRKAEYVAISNTLIGIMLLVLGIAAGALMAIGLELAIAVLSLLALIGAAVTLSLRSVQD